MYRSTETINYLRCPAYRQLKKDGWSPRGWGNKEVAAAIGSGIHAGTAVLDGSALTSPGGIRGAQRTALQVFTQEITQLPGEPQTKVAKERAKKGPQTIEDVLTMYAEVDPLETAGLGVEECERRLVVSTADRIVHDKDGRRAVADLKTKTFPKTNPDYYRRNYTLDFSESWQMKQYLYEARCVYDEWVYDVYLVLIDLNAVHVSVLPFHITHEEQMAWLLDAEQVWADMRAVDAGDRHAYRVDNHRTQYGLCEFFSGCFNEGSLELDYENGGLNLYAKGGDGESD